ncbi:MAG TPA: hypothetical protein VMA36_18090 [Candidatus Limnocylindria bacterium]|nr:hypothetical protein [Candidatus Limnocylindria bacterium]
MTGPWRNGDPRELARAILAGPQYRSAPAAPAQRSWWEMLADALRALWDRLVAPFAHVFGNDRVTQAIGIVVVLALLALLAVLVVRLARRAAAARVRGSAVPEVTALGAEANAAALRERALAAAGEGRYREAAALLWISALHALDEHGRVRFDAARTPSEWRRIVRDPAFDAFARDAVVALFAPRAADASLVERMRAAYERVIAAA